jgi:PAS domain S-box-containing protein
MPQDVKWEALRARLIADPSLQALSRLPDVYFFVKDRQRRFLCFNENFCNLMGRSADDLLGKRDEELSPEYLVEHYRPDDNAVLTGGIELNELAELVRNPRGNYDWNITSKWPVRTAQGEIVAVAGLTRRLLERSEFDSHYLMLTPAVELIASNLSRKIGAEELARSVSLSSSQFRRLFRRRFGCSVQEYQRNIRVRAVCELLALTDLSLSSIAGQCGYYDQSHLTNEFRKMKGITPRLYRERFQVSQV